MKKRILISLSILIIFSMKVCVFASEPIWQISGSKIGFKNFSGSNEFIVTDFYSHNAEENSDYYCENKTINEMDYKHIIPVGFETRPLKQINLEIPIGNPEEIIIVNGSLISEGDQFYTDFKTGMCIKAVVRSNFPETSILKYNSNSIIVKSETPLSGNEEWEEIYFVIPEGDDVSVFSYSIFIFGDTNKEDYPDSVYVDIASIAIFNSYNDAINRNIAPEVILEVDVTSDVSEIVEPEKAKSVIPEKTETVITVPQTFDAIGFAFFAVLISTSTITIIKKKNKK